MFAHLNNILYKKQPDTDLVNLNEDKEFQPFLIQRWCTMYSTSVTSLVNDSTNRYWKIYENNKDWYAALDSIIPTCRFKKISYIKKTKKEIVKKSNETILKVANNLEISSREVNQYIEYFNLILPKQNDEKHTTQS
jgi:hypothetical protein